MEEHYAEIRTDFRTSSALKFLWIRSQQASPASTGLQNEFRIIRARVPATFGYVSSQNRIVSPRNCKVKLVWLSAAALIGLVAFRAVLFSILFLGKCVYTDDTPAPDPILGRPHFLCRCLFWLSALYWTRARWTGVMIFTNGFAGHSESITMPVSSEPIKVRRE